MNTKQAFNCLLERLKGGKNVSLIEQLGLTKAAIRDIRRRKKNDTLSKELMKDLLKKAGWTPPAELWTAPQNWNDGKSVK